MKGWSAPTTLYGATSQNAVIILRHRILYYKLYKTPVKAIARYIILATMEGTEGRKLEIRENKAHSTW
jgi:hypothetical protein